MKPIVIIAIVIVGSIIAIGVSTTIFRVDNTNSLDNTQSTIEEENLDISTEVELDFKLPDNYLETSRGLERLPEGETVERISSEKDLEYSKMTVLEMNQVYLNCTYQDDSVGFICRDEAMDMARAYCGDEAYDCGFYICPCVDEVVDVIYDKLLKSRSEQSIEIIYDKLEKARSGIN